MFKLALATESCKLEKQFLTAQNMASHYRKVINARRMSLIFIEL